MQKETERNKSKIIYLLIVIIIEVIVVYFISYFLYLKLNPLEAEEALRFLSYFKSSLGNSLYMINLLN